MSKNKFDKIYIEVTNICNLNCSFCHKTKRKQKYMEVKEFEEIIEKIKEHTDLVFLHVTGEPLLSPHLEEMLNICYKNNMKVNITTNGTLLKQKKEIIKKAKSLRQLNISLHSYTENKGMSNTYLKETIETVNEISEENDIYISYRLWNLEDISKNSDNKEILQELEKLYKMQNLIEKAKNNKSIELAKKIFLNQDIKFTWPDINGNKINCEGKCYGLRKQIAILVNGDIVPCCLDAEGEIILGNIHKENISEILNKKTAIEMKKGFEQGELTQDLCKTCGFIKKFN